MASRVLEEVERHFLSKSPMKSTTFAAIKPSNVSPGTRKVGSSPANRVHWSPKSKYRHHTILSGHFTETGKSGYEELPEIAPAGKGEEDDKSETTINSRRSSASRSGGQMRPRKDSIERTGGQMSPRKDSIERTRGQMRPRKDSIERTAAHNWILLQENKDAEKRYQKRSKHLQITFEKQVTQTNEMLNRRMKEVRHMCKLRCEAISIMPNLSEHKRELVETLTDTNSVDFMEMRRRRRTLLDHFRHAAIMVLIMVRGFNDTRRRYHHVDAMGRRPIKGEEDLFMDVKFKREEPVVAAGMAPELYMSLTTQASYRKHDEITKILWVIRASKAFRDMFPEDMEYELARRVTYEKYDNGRVIAYQHRVPERFYHVLSGKCNLLTEYNLNSGTVTRVVAEMGKGEHSNGEALEKLWNRETHLVAKGSVELLSLDRDDYIYLTRAEEGLPLDFMRTIELFSEFPLEALEGESTESIYCRYYGRGQIIVDDSNRAPWIILVKTGQVKVIRMQPVLNVEAYNHYDKLVKRHPNDPIHIKSAPLKHADAMMDLLGYQREMKQVVGQLRQKRRRSQSLAANASLCGQKANQSDKRKKKSVRIQTPNQTDEMTEKSQTEPPEEEHPSETSAKRRNIPKFTLPVLINVPMLNTGEATAPVEKVWLSQVATLPDLPQIARKNQMENKVLPQRSAYVQLDVLQNKDVFGLDHLHEAKFSEAKGVTLVSDGAEVIAVSKRFFLQHANNNTMLKVETMFKDYMSMNEAQDALYCKANWGHYKHQTLKQTINSLTRKRK